MSRALALVCAVLLGGCAGPATPDGPPEVRYGLDACSRCRMILAEPRFAAARVSATGVERFDDLACLAAHLAEHGAGGDIWVHSFPDDRWLRTDEARFVYREGLATPMGSGWIAFPAGEVPPSDEPSWSFEAFVSRVTPESPSRTDPGPDGPDDNPEQAQGDA